MILHLRKDTATAVGLKKWAPFGLNIDEDRFWTHRDTRELDLSGMGPGRLKKLRALLEANAQVRGLGAMLRDLGTWEAALRDAGSQRPRTVEQFASLLTKLLADTPGHRVYNREDDGAWLAYYVNSVQFHPEQRMRDNYQPAYATMNLRYEEFNAMEDMRERFYDSDCHGTVLEALARKGWFPETPSLRTPYLEEAQRYSEIAGKVGKQFWAVGQATDNMDGNPDSRDDSWYWHRTHTIEMVKADVPSRVVVDVFYEGSKKRDEATHLDKYFWDRWGKRKKLAVSDDEDEDDVFEDDGEIFEQGREADAIVKIEVPVHPYVPVFDLAKHLRLRIHVSYLSEYVYDTSLADKLVLDPKLKGLIKLLLEHKGSTFTDLVRGKSGGAVVLLSGPPGTGKTLTAEVYAESEERALYSVQCSQLGSDPATLEDALLKVFARAARWKAVLLLDEADVYVHERGQSLDQNAIVGVFLRVLEYQSNIMFLTTNRPDDVDDAILSRCVARLPFTIPTAQQQRELWQVLAKATGAAVSPEVAAKIVASSPDISGRDVKNLLKLAMLVKPGEPIAPETVEFVRQFKPTGAAPPPAPLRTPMRAS